MQTLSFLARARVSSLLFGVVCAKAQEKSKPHSNGFSTHRLVLSQHRKRASSPPDKPPMLFLSLSRSDPLARRISLNAAIKSLSKQHILASQGGFR
jgi:hypothetical protein